MNSQDQDKKKYPEGHFVGLGMAFGVAIFAGLGVPLSIATDNYAFVGIGPAMGVGVGLAIGTGLENKYKAKGQIRPLTDQEKSKNKTVFSGFELVDIIGHYFFKIRRIC